MLEVIFKFFFFNLSERKIYFLKNYILPNYIFQIQLKNEQILNQAIKNEVINIKNNSEANFKRLEAAIGQLAGLIKKQN